MTTKKTTTGAGKTRKLKLRKETVKDLDVKSKANGVKGGIRTRIEDNKSITCTITCNVC